VVGVKRELDAAAAPVEQGHLQLLLESPYLLAFTSAVETGNADSARDAITSRFPDHRAERFLTVFSLPAYFPAGEK
jgi:hypothetical protein